VLELHEEHGCHFHVITNQRFPIRTILALGERHGFGRMDVRRVTDTAQAVNYLCKYLSKPRARCLKRARLWSAFGKIERTRVREYFWTHRKFGCCAESWENRQWKMS
jgi:hypothetical protein